MRNFGYMLGQVVAVFVLAAFTPIVIGFFTALGIATVDLLTPGPMTQTLKALVGWPADGSNFGVRMFIGMLVSLPVLVYVVVLAIIEIIRNNLP